VSEDLFPVWNLLLREYALGKLGRFKDDVGIFWYGGREIRLRSERTKGFQESIFNDEIKGAFDIEIWRDLDADEQRLVRERYAHLSAAEREAMIRRLTRLRTGEMEPYYIMRYGFYEGHTEYRVDPITIAVTFRLKPLAEIDKAFDGRLDRVLAAHFKSTSSATGLGVMTGCTPGAPAPTPLPPAPFGVRTDRANWIVATSRLTPASFVSVKAGAPYAARRRCVRWRGENR
jgi:hypothetical protein